MDNWTLLALADRRDKRRALFGILPQLTASADIPQALLYKPDLTDKDFQRIFPVLSGLESRLTLDQRGRLDAAVIEQWVASFRAKVRRMDTEVSTCRSSVPSRSARR